MTDHTEAEPAQQGEDLRQTQIYMRSDRVKPGDSPRQPQIIDKGSARVEPVPARTVIKPSLSPRIQAGPQAPLTARDKRAMAKINNKHIIGSKRNNAKNASRKRIASLIRTQLKIDETAQQPDKTSAATPNKRRDTVQGPKFTYHAPFPKGKPSPAPVKG